MNITKKILEIIKNLEHAEKYFNEIISALLCMGYKKESGININFVNAIKEFVDDERIQNSKYSFLLKHIYYQNIDKKFLSNLNSLLSLILKNGKEENIKFIINKLKKTDDSKSIFSQNKQEFSTKSQKSTSIKEEINTKIKEESKKNNENKITINNNQQERIKSIQDNLEEQKCKYQKTKIK